MAAKHFYPRTINAVLVCVGFLLSAAPAQAQERYDNSWTFSVHFENDLFADTDQNYTNGIKLSWVSPDLTRFRDSERLPDWSHKYVEMLPFINDKERERNIVFSLGQSIFTPQDTTRTDLIREDRPYAGWLYFGAAFHSKKPSQLDSLEVQFGIVGPLSLAEEAQTLVHEIRNLTKPKGWDNQIENEPGINFIYERKWRSSVLGTDRGMGFDVISHMGGALGNVFTYGNMGFELRAGWNLPKDFGTSPIRPGGDTNDPVHKRDPRRASDAKFGLHFFAYVDGRGVLRDIFLDGNTIADSHSVDKRRFVADFAAGAAIIYDRVKLSYAKLIRTREFDHQPSNHRFGSVTLSYTF